MQKYKQQQVLNVKNYVAAACSYISDRDIQLSGRQVMHVHLKVFTYIATYVSCSYLRYKILTGELDQPLAVSKSIFLCSPLLVSMLLAYM